MGNDLLQRIEALESAEATRSALNDYCLALDTGNFALLEQGFATHVVLVLPGGETCEGREQVLDFFRKATAQPALHRKHFNTNVAIRHSDANGARGDCYFMSLLGEPGEFVLAWGRFIFTTAREGGNARITRLELDVEQAPSPMSYLAGR